jgi:hypothetical protein
VTSTPSLDQASSKDTSTSNRTTNIVTFPGPSSITLSSTSCGPDASNNGVGECLDTDLAVEATEQLEQRGYRNKTENYNDNKSNNNVGERHVEIVAAEKLLENCDIGYKENISDLSKSSAGQHMAGRIRQTEVPTQ